MQIEVSLILLVRREGGEHQTKVSQPPSLSFSSPRQPRLLQTAALDTYRLLRLLDLQEKMNV